MKCVVYMLVQYCAVPRRDRFLSLCPFPTVANNIHISGFYGISFKVCVMGIVIMEVFWILFSVLTK